MTSITKLFGSVLLAIFCTIHASIILYEDPYYQGRFLTVPGTNITLYYVPRWLDQEISSLRIEPEIPGEEWRLYSHNLSGPALLVENDKSDLDKINWNDRISYLIRVAQTEM